MKKIEIYIIITLSITTIYITHCMEIKKQYQSDVYTLYINETIRTQLEIINTITKRIYTVTFNNNIFNQDIVIKMPYIIAISRTKTKEPYDIYLCIWDITHIDQNCSYLYYTLCNILGNYKPEFVIKCESSIKHMMRGEIKNSSIIKTLLQKYKKTNSIISELLDTKVRKKKTELSICEFLQ